jgi:hypothetical protein
LAVGRVIHAARPLGDTSPPFLAVEIDRDLIRALRPEAASRAISVPRLIREILETVATDKLVGAVLDDGKK